MAPTFQIRKLRLRKSHPFARIHTQLLLSLIREEFSRLFVRDTEALSE